jgi:hypothetical protein
MDAKMATLPKFIYIQYNPYPNLTGFLEETDKLMLEFIWKFKGC